MRMHNEKSQLIMSQEKAEPKSAFKNSPAHLKNRNRKVAGENMEEQAFLAIISNLGQIVEPEAADELMEEDEDA
jgi:hypothetical protein